MQLHHVLATTDHSDFSGGNVLVTAFELARRAGARLTVLTVVEREDLHPEASERLERWVESLRSSSDVAITVHTESRTGIPGVEICRFADEHAVDLIVVGRHHRTEMERLLIGDTADAVARRSRVPCLSLPADAGPSRRIHVALDGSHRGSAVLRTARDFAFWADARLTAVTVEPSLPDESLELALSVPSARTLSLQEELSTFKPLHPGLDVRRGPVVESLLESLADAGADTLAIGVHRGGPPGVAEAGSVARRMLHMASCAVLTIPL